MNRVKLREVLILFIVLLIFINLIFFRYMYIPAQNNIKKLKEDLVTINNRLQTEQELFLNNLKIFEKIMGYNKIIENKEIAIWYLERNIDLDDKISDVIKQLFIDSGIKFSTLSLVDTAKDGNKKNYIFNIKFVSDLQKLLYLIDTIENHKKPMQISSININNTGDHLEIDMTLKLITMEKL
ncbi:MAG: hypothetical protein ACP5JI_00495 [Calditerrivibrio sp.]|uniref:Uncharacterized protein n=2 Tax=Calditerrivibrio TaxID=545865 RepID=A0A2J6WGZ1_9BACT|nr:MAG: hypothetical protein C0187_06610 [Calditerrivibrio nitroreducens]